MSIKSKVVVNLTTHYGLNFAPHAGSRGCLMQVADPLSSIDMLVVNMDTTASPETASSEAAIVSKLLCCVLFVGVMVEVISLFTETNS